MSSAVVITVEFFREKDTLAMKAFQASQHESRMVS